MRRQFDRTERSEANRSVFNATELFRFLEKATHLTLREEIKMCAWVTDDQPEMRRIWKEFIRQVQSGIRH